MNLENGVSNETFSPKKTELKGYQKNQTTPYIITHSDHVTEKRKLIYFDDVLL